MDIEQIKCPSCGATINADYSREKMFCSYCGNPVLISKPKPQTINVNNVVNNTYQGVNVINNNGEDYESVINMAKLYYDSNQMEKARGYIEKALKIDSTNVEAWKLKIKTIDDQLLDYVPINYTELGNLTYFINLLDELAVSRNAVKMFSKSDQALSQIDQSLARTVEIMEGRLLDSVKNCYSKKILDLMEEKIPPEILSKSSIEIKTIRESLKEEKLKAKAKFEEEKKKSGRMFVTIALIMLAVEAAFFLTVFIIMKVFG